MQGLAEVSTYAVLKGLPGWPFTEATDLLASRDDRAPALAELAKAVTDGRVPPADHERLERRVHAMKRDVRARLEHAHGPRPYGRLPADESTTAT